MLALSFEQIRLLNTLIGRYSSVSFWLSLSFLLFPRAKLTLLGVCLNLVQTLESHCIFWDIDNPLVTQHWVLHKCVTKEKCVT